MLQEPIDDKLPSPRPPREPEITEDGLFRDGAALLTPEAAGERDSAAPGRPSRAERYENDKALMQLARLKHMQAILAYKLSKRLGKRVAILVNEIQRIITSPPQQFDGPRVALINKLLDKLLPEVTIGEQDKRETPHAPALQIVVQNVDRGRMRVARAIEPAALEGAVEPPNEVA